ncbi:hypothetical protein ACFCX4_09050 [Kitasatospora sp. NPDC056327]
MPVPPRFRCRTCCDWGTVLPPAGGPPIPCPEPQCPIRKNPPAPAR